VIVASVIMAAVALIPMAVAMVLAVM